MSISIRMQDLELEEDCRKCDGYGWMYPVRGERYLCSRCKGTGNTISEEGVALITFLKKYWDQVE